MPRLSGARQSKLFACFYPLRARDALENLPGLIKLLNYPQKSHVTKKPSRKNSSPTRSRNGPAPCNTSTCRPRRFRRPNCFGSTRSAARSAAASRMMRRFCSSITAPCPPRQIRPAVRRAKAAARMARAKRRRSSRVSPGFDFVAVGLNEQTRRRPVLREEGIDCINLGRRV